jgi:exonuclease V gamma subunit
VLRIHTSHRTEVLLDAFVENLAAERKLAGAWATVQVAVPNGNVETYLRRGVAERLGLAANIETSCP